MSYNQRCGKMNKSESKPEEVEKGRFNLRPVEGDLKSALETVDRVVRAMQKAAKETVEAREKIKSASNYLQALHVSRDVAPKRSKQGDEKELREMERALRALAKQVDDYGDKIPYETGMMTFNIPFVTIISKIKEFNKKR